MSTKLSIVLNLYAGLEKYCGNRKWKDNQLELDKGYDINNLVEKLGIPKQKVNLVIVNGQKQDIFYKLQDGDIVSLFPFVTGG